MNILSFLILISIPCSVYSQYTVNVGINQCNSCSNYIRVVDPTNALSSLQTAFNMVRSQGGGIVNIHQGTYVIERNLQVYSNTHMRGAGMNLTILKLRDFAPPWINGSSARSGFIRAVFKDENNKCENIIFSDFTLDGNKVKQNKDQDSKYGRYGFFTEGCTNILADSLRIHSFQGYGFDPHGWKNAPGGPRYGKNTTIVNSIAHDNDWDGFTLDQTDGMYVSNCISYRNGRHGYNVVTGSYNVIIENSTSYDNGYYYYTGAGGCGVMIQNNQLFGTRKTTVRNSWLNNDKKGGVCTEEVYDILVENMRIKTPKDCFRLFDSWNQTYRNNLCDAPTMFKESNTQTIIKINNQFFKASKEELNMIIGQTECNEEVEDCVYYTRVNPTQDAQPFIQDALDSIYSSGFGTLYIKRGTYLLSKFIEMESNIHLKGDGMNVTILKLADFATPWRIGTFRRSGFLRSTLRAGQSCGNLTVSHITLDGNKLKQNNDSDSQYGRYGWFTEGCDNVTANYLHVMNWQGYGFDPHGWKSAPGGALWAKNLTITNCVSDNNDWDGFTLDQTDGIYLENCIARNNGRHGYNIVTGTRNTYMKNITSINNGYYYFTGPVGCGVAIQNNMNFGTRNIIVTNGILINDSRGGVCVNGVLNSILDKFDIKTTQSCFRVSGSTNINITNNVCDSSIRRLASISTSTNVLQLNNTLVVPTPSPPPNIPDPTCSFGIRFREFCCAASCGTCGGSGCGTRQGGSSSCCTSNIQASGRSCSENSAPCII